MSSPFAGMSGPFMTTQKPAEFVIMPIDDDGSEDSSIGGKRILQYWPPNVDSSDSANWQTQEAFGAPLPFHQWVNGSEHTVNITATFSRDMDGEIKTEVEEDKFNVDIEAAIAWLRMLKTNSYRQIADIGKVSVAPPVLWIYMPGVVLSVNTRAAQGFGQASVAQGQESGMYCLLTEVGVNRENWFQSGRTRYANVSLSFTETMQIGGEIFPFSQSDFVAFADRYKRKPS